MKSTCNFLIGVVLACIIFIGCKKDAPEIVTSDQGKPEEVLGADTLGYDSVDVFISGAEYVALNKYGGQISNRRNRDLAQSSCFARKIKNRQSLLLGGCPFF